MQRRQGRVNQQWRAPLREALDFLRDATAPLAEALADPLLIDLWSARDAYIDIVLDRSQESMTRFFERHAERPITEEERTTLLELLELERHAQLMYTSCGWFFDDIAGIETQQILAYAGRVLQLAGKLFGDAGAALEEQFLEILAEAKSNLPEMGTVPPSIDATSPDCALAWSRWERTTPSVRYFATTRRTEAVLFRRASRLVRELHLRPGQGGHRPCPCMLAHHGGDRGDMLCRAPSGRPEPVRGGAPLLHRRPGEWGGVYRILQQHRARQSSAPTCPK